MNNANILTIFEIIALVQNMQTSEIDHACATEIMGWNAEEAASYSKYWHPTLNRSQSRNVTNELLRTCSLDDIVVAINHLTAKHSPTKDEFFLIVTPEEESRAAVLAKRIYMANKLELSQQKTHFETSLTIKESQPGYHTALELYDRPEESISVHLRVDLPKRCLGRKAKLKIEMD